MHRSTALVVTLVLAASGVAGCGGSSAQRETTGEPATTEEGDTAEETTTEDATSKEAAESIRDVVMAQIEFRPKTITVPVDTTVRWTNKDAAQHTVTSTEGTKVASELLNEGETYEATFRKAGTFRYFCEVHPFMEGVLVVVNAS